MRADFEVLWMLAEHLLLTGLPAAAAVLLAVRRGMRAVPLLLAVALAASGAAALLVFWSFYVEPWLGKGVDVALLLASALAAGVSWRRGVERDALRGLAIPAALWALASAFVLFLGFIHGGAAQPLTTAATRFSHQLPDDNEIPSFFANWFYLHGHHGTPPLFGDWLASDRPPLQIGYALAQRPFGWDASGLQYQVLGVVVQQLWILGMWALLCAAKLPHRTRGLVALAAIVSNVAIVHAFFVWPKLIAAAFLLAALAIVLSADWPALRRDGRIGALLAALCSLAFLAHGSSAFFILPLLLVGAARGVPSRRWLGVAAAVLVVLVAPWSAYQRYGDPPGDRLIKWQLGGSLEVGGPGALSTIVDSYEEAGVGGTLENKWGNVTQLLGAGEVEDAVRGAIDEAGAGNPGRVVEALRLPLFFDLLPALGLLLLGPVAMLAALLGKRAARQAADWRFASTALGICALACLFWVLLMFGGPNAKTWIHQGSLALPLLAICGCVAGACAVDRRFGTWLVGLDVLVTLILFLPSLTPPPGSSYSALAGLLAVASLLALCAVSLAPCEAVGPMAGAGGREQLVESPPEG